MALLFTGDEPHLPAWVRAGFFLPLLFLYEALVFLVRFFLMFLPLLPFGFLLYMDDLLAMEVGVAQIYQALCTFPK